ncbi:GIY-YIG nuclease family protein [Candidatus Parcubacteria bacterium]|nr:GIY-YIG nuclease family protein [Candidatus Parcubacteria bacterium]
MTLEQFKKKTKHMPDTPGVYFFLGKRKEVLYIGKAASLRDRVRSYFAPDIAEVRSPLIAQMVERASSLDWRKTDSVLEALLLEANLIKNYKPKFNTDAKDDKSWNYVVITKEDFPRVLLVRGRVLEKDFPLTMRAHTFGPFPHGLQLREALKIIRKIFPYRDMCKPQTGKPCFNAQIGLCPGVCAGTISKRDYRKIIRRIALLFAGKKDVLMKSLEKDMKLAAREEEFEEAQRLSRQIYALKHIQDVSLIKDEYRNEAQTIRAMRIEAYDMAHLGGMSNVGVMTVVEDSEAQKSEYRKFRIRSAKPGDDPGALREVLSRRLGHDDWPMPRLIVVDGSTAQMNAANATLKECGVHIPVVGVVKDEKHRPREIKGDQQFIKGRERDILLANAEAHRFAITYHRKRVRDRVRQ